MTRATVIAAIKSLLIEIAIGIAKLIRDVLILVAIVAVGCTGALLVVWLLFAAACNIADQESAKAARELHLDQGK